MKLAHYEGRGLHMKKNLNFLFIKICGRNRAASATNSDLFGRDTSYNQIRNLMLAHRFRKLGNSVVLVHNFLF